MKQIIIRKLAILFVLIFSHMTMANEPPAFPPTNAVYPHNEGYQVVNSSNYSPYNESQPLPSSSTLYPYNEAQGLPPTNAVYPHSEGHHVVNSPIAIGVTPSENSAASQSPASLTNCQFTINPIIDSEDGLVREGALGFDADILTEGGCRLKFKDALENFLRHCPQGVEAVRTSYSYGLGETERGQYGCYQNSGRSTAEVEDRAPSRVQRRYHHQRHHGGSGDTSRGNK